MKTTKRTLILGLLVSLGYGSFRVHAQTNEILRFNTFGGTRNLTIPDGDLSGVNDLRNISSSITRIDSLRVTLDISADFNGDLYGYLSHGNGFSVLLNRVGRSASLPSGYADGGMNITLSDTANLGDIHIYQTSLTLGPGNPLTGVWQPDARNIDPGFVLDSTPQSAFLSSFNGTDANGLWTLYLVDMQTGGNSALNGWSLEIMGIPEPKPLHLLLVAGIFWMGFSVWRSRAR